MASRQIRFGRNAAALVILAFLGGCLPEYVSETPSIYGSVLDAGSGAPIGGATLRYPDFPATVVTTGADGGFNFPAIRKWEIVILFGDRNPAMTLNVAAPGYRSRSLRVYLGAPGRCAIQLQREGSDSARGIGSGRSSWARVVPDWDARDALCT
jgi:hypothetical protein